MTLEVGTLIMDSHSLVGLLFQALRLLVISGLTVTRLLPLPR
jgi:hypothetical protein